MKNVIKLVCVILTIMMLVVCFAGCGGSSSPSYGSSNSGGFVGSDGEYHSYIPEFGDDVNNWMAENW